MPTMPLRRLSLTLTVSLTLAVLAACEAPSGKKPATDTFTSDEAALIVDTNVRAHVGELAEALKAFEASNWIGDLVGRNECPPPQEGQPSECHGPLDFTAQTDALANFLRDHVFDTGSVESQDGTSVTYRLQAADVCPEVMDTNGDTVPEADCAKLLADVPMRLVVTNPGENSVGIAFQAGTAAPATFTLDPGGVSLSIDLAEAKAAVQQVTASVGESAFLPETMDGAITLSLLKQASLSYELVVGVTETVHVGSHPAESPDHFLVELAPAARALAFTLDGADRKVLAGLDFQAIDVALALDLIAGEDPVETCLDVEPFTCTTTEPTPKTGVVRAQVPGLSGSGDFEGTTDVLDLANLGLGDATSTVTFNGFPVFSLDLNALAGRRFAIHATHAEGTNTIAVSPSFSAKLTHDLTSLLDQLGEDVPEWAKNGWVSVDFSGAEAPTFALEQGAASEPVQPCLPDDPNCGPTPAPVECGGENQPACEDPAPVECGGENQPACEEPGPPAPTRFARLVSGTLTFAANDVEPVVISAPMCVVDGGEGEHPISMLRGEACE